MSAARILIVEDEAIVAKDIQTSLARLGYTVLGARASGEEAVAAARELQPDLILMDIKLKGPLDGIEAAARIRRDRDIPVIYLTAFTDDDTLRRATATDAFGYLLKPFEDRELRSTIEMALYKHTMERRLQESREWLEAVLHCIRDAVIATDGQGRIQFMNPMAESLTGWRQPEAIGRKLTDVFCLVRADHGPLGDSDMAAMLEHGSSSQPNDRSVLVSRDGNRIPVAHGAAPIRCARGLLHGVVVSFRDITEHQAAQERERQLQDRLARGQRMESLGRLAGGVAHQLNGILGPMLAYPDLIARTLPGDSPARQDLEIVKNSVRKALEVARDLLTLGLIGHDAMLPLSLNRLVEETLA